MKINLLTVLLLACVFSYASAQEGATSQPNRQASTIGKATDAAAQGNIIEKIYSSSGKELLRNLEDLERSLKARNYLSAEQSGRLVTFLVRTFGEVGDLPRTEAELRATVEAGIAIGIKVETYALVGMLDPERAKEMRDEIRSNPLLNRLLFTPTANVIRMEITFESIGDGLLAAQALFTRAEVNLRNSGVIIIRNLLVRAEGEDAQRCFDALIKQYQLEKEEAVKLAILRAGRGRLESSSTFKVFLHSIVQSPSESSAVKREANSMLGVSR